MSLALEPPRALVTRMSPGVVLCPITAGVLDADMARRYGVSTQVLSQTVKRNRERFPEDFMFRLTVAEKEDVITNCDHLRPLRFSPSLPHAFTEHGAMILELGRVARGNVSGTFPR